MLFMEDVELLIKHTLTLFPNHIDISDGEVSSDNGFFSRNLSAVWWGAEDKNGNDYDDVAFMIWAIYGLLHRKSRENYLKGIYTVTLDELSLDSIEKAYRKAVEEAEQ